MSTQAELDRLEFRNRVLACLHALDAARTSQTLAEVGRRIARSLLADQRQYPPIERSARAVVEAEGDATDSVERLARLLLQVHGVVGKHDDDAGAVRVLLVAPDTPSSCALELALASRTRTLLRARSAAEAKGALVGGESVDVAVVSLSLPDGDGRALLLELRGRISTAHVPLVVLSDEPSAEAECFALGADAYFQEPFDVAAVSTAVAEKLRRTAVWTRESRRDPLTGGLNRAAFGEVFAQASAHLARAAEPLSLALLDLNGFKAVNDEHGHLVGDALLRAVHKALARALRAADVVARWGGDEFVALLPGTDLAGGARAMQGAIDAVAKVAVRGANGAPVHPSISAGVAQLEAGTTLEAAVHEADQQLYAAKARGARLSTADLAPPPTTGPRSLVVVVDADAEAVRPLEHTLKREGNDVLIFASGAHALGVAPRGVALWILDSRSLEPTGLELLHQLRATHGADVPVLVMSASGRPTEAAEAFDHGADGFVRKPIGLHELVARVRRLLVRGAAAPRTPRATIGQLASAFVGDQLLEIVQMLGLNSKRGVLRVTSNKLSGTLTLRDGRLVAAETSTRRRGLEGALELLSRRFGRFEFRLDDAVASDGDLDLPIEAALLEVLRLRDEATSD